MLHECPLIVIVDLFSPFFQCKPPFTYQWNNWNDFIMKISFLRSDWSSLTSKFFVCMNLTYFNLFFLFIFMILFSFLLWNEKFNYFLTTHAKNRKQKHLKFKTNFSMYENRTAESVDLDLSANVASSQNLLFDSSAMSASNDLHAIASSFGVNNTTGSSYESPSVVSSTSVQQQATGGGAKKESNLFGWFASSTSTSTSSAAQNMSATSTSSSAASPPSIVSRSNQNQAASSNGQDEGSSPSTNISSKLSYGEKYKFNKNGSKATRLDQQAVELPPESSKVQQKSSRRTTSLLNLFMSNSQGKNKSHLHLEILQRKVA